MGTKTARQEPTGAPANPDAPQQQWLEFASRAAHDMVGPVDQLLSLVALFIQRYRGKLDADADALLTYMESAQKRLGATASGLRKCFNAGSLPCAKTKVNMNELMTDVLAALKPAIQASQANIHVDDLPEVQADRQLLCLLFQSVLENALKFRGESVHPQINLSAVPSSGGVLFLLNDNGIGIEPQYAEAVFDPFKKLNGQLYPGAGMGLTLARIVADLHGGRVWIEPSVQGTQVRIELPA